MHGISLILITLKNPNMAVFGMKCKITIFNSHISVNIPDWEFAEEKKTNNNMFLPFVLLTGLF